jgi:hypothetical protein
MPLAGARGIRGLDRDGEWKQERRPVRAAADFYDYWRKQRFRRVLRAQAVGPENEKRHREHSSSPSRENHPSI